MKSIISRLSDVVLIAALFIFAAYGSYAISTSISRASTDTHGFSCVLTDHTLIPLKIN